MPASQVRTYRFGPFELDRKAEQLRRNGAILNLTGQPYRLLALLVERPGELVTRDEVRQLLWKDREFVDFESGINGAAKRIRDVLEDSSEEPQYLQTVRGRGYRFVAAVETDVAPVAQAAPPARAASIPVRRRLSRGMVGAGVLVAFLLVFSYWTVGSHGVPSPGMRMTQFTRSGIVESAAISPDGRLLAYIDAEDGNRQLRVCDVKSHECTAILERLSFVSNLIFSPDAEFLYLGAFGGPSVGNNILRIPVRGGPPATVVHGASALRSLSRDGKQILFTKSNSREDALYLADLSGGEPRRVMTRYRPDRLSSGALSPDGTLVAAWWLVTNPINFYYSVTVTPLAGGPDKTLSTTRWPPTYNPSPDLVWLQDGSGLLGSILDAETDRRQIYQVSYPDGTVRRVTQDLTSYQGFSVTADGRTLATIKDDTVYQLWVSNGNKVDQMQQVTSGSPGFTSPAWTPDGNLVAMSQGIVSIDPATGRKRAVPGTNARDRDPRPSPDGKSFYFTSERSNEGAVWKMNLDGSGIAQVTSQDSGGGHKLSPDGRWLVYAGFAEDGITIWRRPADGGTPVRITPAVQAMGPAISPDGKWVAATLAETPGKLGIFPLDGGEAVKTLNAAGMVVRGLWWTPDGTALTYIKTVKGISNIWRLPVDGSPAQPLTSFSNQLIDGFGWSRDGRLVVSRAFQAVDVVIIGDFRPH